MLGVSGCRAKIERAKKHISDFDRERIAFLDSNPYVVIPKFDEKSDVTQSIMGPMPVIPSVLAVIVGDAAQNLRSALDYLAAELVRSNGGNPKLVYFPIFETAEKYIAESSGKTKGIAAAAKQFIDEIQPYGGGHCAGLWALHSMNNADKHRLLVTISTNIAKSVVFKLSPVGNAFSVKFEVPGLKEGDILGEVSGNSEADHRIYFTFDIAFGEPKVVAGESVVPTLTHMMQIVEAVVTAFESRF